MTREQKVQHSIAQSELITRKEEEEATLHSGPALGIRMVGPKKIVFELDPGAVS